MQHNFSPYLQTASSPARSAWEQFLDKEGIPEFQCFSLLKDNELKGHVIRSWVLEHYKTSFVPELVIQAMGLQHQIISRLQLEHD